MGIRAMESTLTLKADTAGLEAGLGKVKRALGDVGDRTSLLGIVGGKNMAVLTAGAGMVAAGLMGAYREYQRLNEISDRMSPVAANAFARLENERIRTEKLQGAAQAPYAAHESAMEQSSELAKQARIRATGNASPAAGVVGPVMGFLDRLNTVSDIWEAKSAQQGKMNPLFRLPSLDISDIAGLAGAWMATESRSADGPAGSTEALTAQVKRVADYLANTGGG